MANQLNLSDAEIAQIRSQIGAPGSVGQYSAAYRTILSIDDAHRAQGLPALDSNTRYWFEQATAINANDPTSNANLFIREVTAGGLLLDGRNADNLQAISNSIGRSVIDEISSSGGIPNVGVLISRDISTATSEGGQTIGGWGGAFYYWNEPYLTNPDGTTQQTVGQYIQSHPDEYERFIATNARALRDTLISDYSSGGPGAVLRDLVLGATDAQVPASVAQEIVGTAIYGNRTGIYAGDPDAINGWQRTSNGGWERLEGFDPITGAPETITANQATAANLEAIRNLRVDPDYQDASRFSDLPSVTQGGMRGGFIDNQGSDVLQFADGQTGGTDNLIFNANDGATLNSGSGQNSLIAAGNDQTVNGSGNTGSDSVIVQGNGGVVNATNGVIEANFDEVPDDELPTLTVHGPGNRVEEHRSAAVNVDGNDNTLDLDAGGSANVTGTGETISGSNEAITLGANSSADVSGRDNTINAIAGDGFSVSGANNTINLPGATLSQTSGADGSETLTSGGTTITTPAGSTSEFTYQGDGIWSIASWNAQAGVTDQLQLNPVSETTDGTLFHLNITAASGISTTIAIPDASEFQALAGGTFADIQTDTSNSQTWLTRTSDYNSLGHITQSIVENHDGTSEVTVFDAANQQSWSMSETDYNAAHQVVETIVSDDDGTSSSTAYDPANEQPWSTATESYGADETPVERIVNNDDGSRQVSEYDFTGQQQWFESETDYSAQNVVTQATYDWNAGGLQVQLFNPASEISEEVQNFSGADGTGSLTSESFDLPAATLLDTFNSDGTQTLSSDGTSVTAPGGASLALADEGGGAWSVASWSSAAGAGTPATSDELTLNPANEGGDNSTLFNLTITPADNSGTIPVNIPDGSTVNVLADGGFSVSETDPYNLRSWSAQTSDYDRLGQITGRTLTNDDGTSEAMAYDADNQQPWSLIQTHYDAGGLPIENLVYGDDGSSQQTTYDQAGQQTWSSVTDSYDANGVFTSETTYNDNGTQQLTLFNYDPEQPWFMAQGEYNAAGNLTQASYDWTSGGSETYGFDPSNGAVTSEAVYNASGQETELAQFAGTTGDNWETSQSTYDPGTGAETTRVYFAGSGPNDYATDQINFDPATEAPTSEQRYNNGLETDYIQYSATGSTYATDVQYNAQGQVTDTRYYAGSAAHSYETEEVDYNAATGAETYDNLYSVTGQRTELIEYAGTTGDNWETAQINFNSSGQETQEIDFAGSGPTDYETQQSTFNPATGGEMSRQLFNASGMETADYKFIGTATNDYETSYESFNSAGVEYEYQTRDASGAVTNDYFLQTNGEYYNSNTGQYYTDPAGSLLEAGSSDGFGYSPVDYYYDYLSYYGGGYSGGFDDFSGFGDDGGFDFAAAPAAGVAPQNNVVSQYDRSIGEIGAAMAADAAAAQALRVSQLAGAPDPSATASFESGRWENAAGAGGDSAPVITWSIANSPGTRADPFSGYIGTDEEPMLDEAFQQWAQASGLRFEEVPDSSSADIRIGWGDFGTSQSGVVGYTSFEQRGGAIEPGAIIRLEDPAETPLTQNAEGQSAYAGTDAELFQVALHEIGHALGLADNSDQNSAMFYESTSANRSLDSTDIGNIRQLYGPAWSTSVGG